MDNKLRFTDLIGEGVKPLKATAKRAPVVPTKQPHSKQPTSSPKPAQRVRNHHANSHHASPAIPKVFVQKQGTGLTQPLGQRAERISSLDTSNYLRTPDETLNARSRLIYFSDGLSHKQRKALINGKVSIDTTLDLHGMSGNEALHYLHGQLKLARTYHWRHVQIIHGKSKDKTTAILKTYLKSWLDKTPAVLGYASKMDNQGESGAVIVLLKSSTLPREPH